MSAQPVPAGPGGEAADEPVALLLMDRGLDLASPCTHAPHVLDRTVEVLRRREDAMQFGRRKSSSGEGSGTAPAGWRCAHLEWSRVELG